MCACTDQNKASPGCRSWCILVDNHTRSFRLHSYTCLSLHRCYLPDIHLCLWKDRKDRKKISFTQWQTFRAYLNILLLNESFSCVELVISSLANSFKMIFFLFTIWWVKDGFALQCQCNTKNLDLRLLARFLSEQVKHYGLVGLNLFVSSNWEKIY